MNDGRNGRYGFARGMLVVSCLFGASLRLAAVDVSWDASEKPATLDGGKITVTYDGDRVSALRIPCVAGGYAFGGDAIDFTDGGTVTVVSSDELPGGCVRFAQALRSPGKLSFASDFSQMSSALASGTARSATLPKVLLKDANLADYDIVSCRMGWASSGETFNLDGCKPYFVTRGEGWMTAQM